MLPTMPSPVVLIADDDPAVRRLLRRVLGAEFTVVEAGDGEEAFTRAKAERPAVVLLDLDMPVLDGHGALIRFRAEPGLRTTPILIVTGAATAGDAAAVFLRDGAHDFVRKPFEDVELVARVRAAYRHKALEEALRSRNRELEAFASFAAHDLKSPLAAIASIVELLTGEGLSLTVERKEEFLRNIGEMAVQGSRLVADLLALAREDWASAAITVAPADVEALIWSVLDEVPLKDADVRVTGTWAKVAVPDAAVRSVFGNLISNAAHYGRDPNGHLDCVITGTPRDGVLEVVFADGGPGIERSVSSRIFEPFVTAPDSAIRNPSSSGLGLAVVGRTLERHGGRAELLTRPTGGTAFRIILPLPSA
jgi:signal transduction histidine kinase